MVSLEIAGTAEGLLAKEGIDPGRVRFANDDARLIVAGLPNGMQGGGTAITLLVQLPDTTWALAQTSLKLFVLAAEHLVEQHGYPDISDAGIQIPPGEMRQRVIALLDRLNEQEARAMTLRYGLDEEGGLPRSTKQVALIMGVDPGMVRALERRASEKLRGTP